MNSFYFTFKFIRYASEPSVRLAFSVVVPTKATVTLFVPITAVGGDVVRKSNSTDAFGCSLAAAGSNLPMHWQFEQQVRSSRDAIADGKSVLVTTR